MRLLLGIWIALLAGVPTLGEVRTGHDDGGLGSDVNLPIPWKPKFQNRNQLCENGQNGLDQILNGVSLKGRIPAKVFKYALDNGLFPTDAKEQYEKFGLVPSDPERNRDLQRKLGTHADIPMALTVTRDSGGSSQSLDNTFISLNCLVCHAGMRANQVIIGASNHMTNVHATTGFLKEHLSQSSLALAFGGAPGYFSLTEKEQVQLRKTNEYFETFLLPSFQASGKDKWRAGNNLGYFVDWLQFASYADNQRVPLEIDFNGGPKRPLFKEMLKSAPPPVLPMPWFIHKQKPDSTYRYAEDRSFPHHTNFGIIDKLPKNASPQEIEKARREEQQYTKGIERIFKGLDCMAHPQYPFPIDKKRAERGCTTFNQQVCVQCHGSFIEKNGRWSVQDYQSGKLRNVGTDAAYSSFVANFGPRVGAQMRAQGIKDPYSTDAKEREILNIRAIRAGFYTPPPLIDLWARAPYLHNGSVATLYDLLTPPGARSDEKLGASKRSAGNEKVHYYKMGDPNAYDSKRVGVLWQPLTKQEYDKAKKDRSEDSTRFFSTADPGLAEGGHPFFIEDYETRMDVLECLKMVSGENVE